MISFRVVMCPIRIMMAHGRLDNEQVYDKIFQKNSQLCQLYL